MKKVIAFGNCQAGQIKEILSSLLPNTEFQIRYLSNNARTGNKKSNQQIIASISNCDVLIYQPLSSAHGDISEENIIKTLKQDCVAVSFPYIFNSGMYSLCHAPKASTHKYGNIFGEEIIHNLILSGKSERQIIQAYRKNEIDFNLKKRFVDSLGIMRRKEMTTNIKLTEFIENNYKNQKLFVTHNHLTGFLLQEIIRQIDLITPLPLGQKAIESIPITDMKATCCPITPHDVRVHGYQFPPDKDWLKKGEFLVKLIYDYFFIERDIIPTSYQFQLRSLRRKVLALLKDQLIY